MWEDGFCGGGRSEDLCLEPDIESEDLVRKAFSKMSIQLYNYGEGWVLGRWLYKIIMEKIIRLYKHTLNHFIISKPFIKIYIIL